MELFCKAIKAFLAFSLTKQKPIYHGPDSLKELLTQFNLPQKEKTQDDIIRDYKIKETMAVLEIDMLKMDPSFAYRGVQRWVDDKGNKFYDWVPCVVRPEIVYCGFSRS